MYKLKIIVKSKRILASMARNRREWRTSPVSRYGILGDILLTDIGGCWLISTSGIFKIVVANSQDLRFGTRGSGLNGRL